MAEAVTQDKTAVFKKGDRLQDQVAIITGGARGIGRVTAELFAANGAKLVIVDVDQDVCEASAKEVAATYGGDVLGLKADVTSKEDCEATIKAALDKFGKIDILVNNAGITKDNLFMRMSEAEWDAVLGVNLKGPFQFCKAVVRPMMKARQGRIINISSVVGQIGNPGQANYSASKGGLIAFTKTLAKELAARNILVNAVAPGFIQTRLTDVLPDDVKDHFKKICPLGRFGEPVDIAKAVLFLASEDASYITGQVLGVNGGLYM